MKASKLFRKYPKTPDFDHSNYRLFERIPEVPGTSNNQGLTGITIFAYIDLLIRWSTIESLIEKGTSDLMLRLSTRLTHHTTVVGILTFVCFHAQLS